MSHSAYLLGSSRPPTREFGLGVRSVVGLLITLFYIQPASGKVSVISCDSGLVSIVGPGETSSQESHTRSSDKKNSEALANCPTTGTGVVRVRAILNGFEDWSGELNFHLSGPIQVAGWEVPESFQAPFGVYELSYLGGGPENGTLVGIVPDRPQCLNDATGTIGFEFRFISPPDVQALDAFLKDRRFPSGILHRTNSTVDGNDMWMGVWIINRGGAGTADIEVWDQTANRLLASAARMDLMPNQWIWLSGEWNTLGDAWSASGEPQFTHRIEVRANGRTVHIQEFNVYPRPVILVHGLWSSAATWSEYLNSARGPGLLSAAHPGWYDGFAVGDGRVLDDDRQPIKIDTGKAGSPAPIPTLLQNAEKLDSYIEGIRTTYNAWLVDVVAHSMGGLITKEYIHHVMPSRPGSRSIHKLVTLGTPHEGTPCWFLAGFAGTSLSRKSCVANNRSHSLREVELYTLGGDPLPIGPCGIWWGTNDLVVPLASALFQQQALISHVSPRLHTLMPASEDDFRTFILPLLAGQHPGAVQPRLPLSGSVPTEDDPVLLYWKNIDRLVDTVELDWTVPDTGRLSVLVGADSNTGMTLLDPTGHQILRAGEEPFFTFAVENPQQGTWRLDLGSLDGSPTSATISVMVTQSPYHIELVAAEMAGLLKISADVRIRGRVVQDARVVAGILGSHQYELELRDDGRHGDGEPGDGRSAASLAVLPGDYIVKVDVSANGSTFGSLTTVFVMGEIFADGFESADTSRWR